MATIELYSDRNRYVTGWYGSCSGKNNDFNLSDIKEDIEGVYQINESETSWDMYNPKLPRGIPQDFDKLIPGFMYFFIFLVNFYLF